MIHHSAAALRAALRVAVIALIAFLLPTAAAGERVVAIGDIHGDLDAFTRILRQAGLIDDKKNWAGGNATLVQTGDYLDRGPQVREVMDQLMALEKQAKKAGGRVLVLLGNHEVMNITGDLRYVTPQNFLSFAGKDAEERRKSAYREWLAWRKRRAEALKQPFPAETPETETAWMNQHPPGYFEHREAFSPSGKYGKWLRSKPAAARVGDVVFVHGGLSPQVADTKVEEIAWRVSEEIRFLDDYRRELADHRIAPAFLDLAETRQAVEVEVEIRKARGRSITTLAIEDGQQISTVLHNFLAHQSWLSFHPDGPLWFRGYAEWSEEEGETNLAALLSKQRAQHVVVGHTVQAKGEIRGRFAGKVFLIDTGMLASYYPGGRPSALEILNGKFTAIYLDRRAVLLDPQRHPESKPIPGGGATPEPQNSEPLKRTFIGPTGTPLPFSSDEEVIQFLRTAKLIWMKGIGEGVTNPRRCLFERDGIRMHAIFRDVDEDKTIARMQRGTELMFRDSALFEPAAYQLARMLGIENVPPAVERAVEGKTGSLQVWIENAMTETTRRLKKKIPPPEPVMWTRQMNVVKVFDALIYNTDRNLGNLVVGPDWKLWMIDHTRAFRRHEDLQKPQGIQRCERRLFERMKQLDKGMLQARLKRYLREAEIEAILKRRDRLVAHIEQLIRERGEDTILYSMDAPIRKLEVPSEVAATEEK